MEIEVVFLQNCWIIFIFTNQGTSFSQVMSCTFFNGNLKRALVLFLGLYSVPVRFCKGHCILEHYFCVIMLLSSLTVSESEARFDR